MTVDYLVYNYRFLLPQPPGRNAKRYIFIYEDFYFHISSVSLLFLKASTFIFLVPQIPLSALRESSRKKLKKKNPGTK